MAVLGIDEVGRGPWAGPLVIGAVILKDSCLDTENWQDSLADSKKLTARKREELSPIILEKAKGTGLGWVSAEELDKVGLADALKLATKRAICDLLKVETLESVQHDTFLPFSEIIIDGTSNFLKDTVFENQVTILPKADAKIKAVSAASIIAKVARDNYMKKISNKFPEYGFEKHVGYGTKQHSEALQKYGPCPEHRTSFKPIQKILGSLPEHNMKPSKTLAKSHGDKAEKIVAEYLKNEKNHTILARNYKTKYYEIDIVSADKNHIYFTEVKYRETTVHGSPLEYIDESKRQKMKFAAESFMQYLSKKLQRPLDQLPSPLLAAAAVKGKEFALDKWLPIVV